MDTLDQPLVSIIVITYNSSKYALETLEGAKTQTCQNIEIIISDDCSTDNTIEICRNWLGENKENFVDQNLLLQLKIQEYQPIVIGEFMLQKGEWIKIIVEDDMFKVNTITDFISSAKQSGSNILMLKLVIFTNEVKSLLTKLKN
ncbi:MAG: glycosyltransferase family 2 protein [Lutibacter sp.]